MIKNKKIRGIKYFFITLLMFIFLIDFTLAASFVAEGSCNLNVSLVNQDPYPAIPGEYVEVLFQVSGLSNLNCKGGSLELVPSYPFSLDSNDSIRLLEGSTGAQGYSSIWNVGYKIRVDKDAIDGNNELKVKYGEKYSNVNNIKKFDIVVQDTRTTFDSVIQESSSSDVSIALANTGKYIANSVVVRIPEQDNYKVTGSDGQMVGNLESGDYTIVSFSVTPVMSRGSGNNVVGESKLKFDIYYTDSIGERRVVNMELGLNPTSSTNMTNFSGMREGFQRSNQFTWSIWYTLAIIAVIVIILFLLRKKILGIFHKKKDYNLKVPEWISNMRDKEKKK